MSEQIQTEIWQVEVAGKIYEAPFTELSEWIGEGSLQPEDKVRRGNLRWIEARRVPALIPFFNAKAAGRTPSVVVSTSSTAQASEEVAAHQIHRNEPALTAVVETASVSPDPRPAIQTGSADPTVCSRHRDAPATYVCGGCNRSYCKACPNSYGGTVKICPDCGQLCDQIDSAPSSDRKTHATSAGMDQPFGMTDFAYAIAFPFGFRASLIMGGVMYMFFTLGQSAWGIGGIMLSAASLICLMFANTLTFGVLANTIDNFTRGQLAADFMPSFDEFSIWDDVVHPFFLSIAAYLVSFGPFFATAIIGVYLVLSAVSSHVESIQADLQRIPGTPYYAGREPDVQSEEVRRVLEERVQRRADELDRVSRNAESGTQPITSEPENTFGGIAPTNIDQDTLDQEELWRSVQDARREQIEAITGKTPEEEQIEFQAMVSGFLKLAAPLVVIGAIAFLWGAFFFPAACAVAGYTRSFMATINPLVGLDTIRRLGLDYIKVLLMGLVIVIAASFVSGLFAAVFSPFAMPGIGNLPAKAFAALFGFYFSVVFSCILGLMLFKASGRLKLPR